MKLKDLIETLQYFPNEMLLTQPKEFISWRGDYRQLSLVGTGGDQTVAELLTEAEALAAGERTVIGYKGGMFVMNPETEVYMDDHGLANGYRLAGFYIENEKLQVVRSETSSY